MCLTCGSNHYHLNAAVFTKPWDSQIDQTRWINKSTLFKMPVFRWSFLYVLVLVKEIEIGFWGHSKWKSNIVSFWKLTSLLRTSDGINLNYRHFMENTTTENFPFVCWSNGPHIPNDPVVRNELSDEWPNEIWYLTPQKSKIGLHSVRYLFMIGCTIFN